MMIIMMMTTRRRRKGKEERELGSCKTINIYTEEDISSINIRCIHNNYMKYMIEYTDIFGARKKPSVYLDNRCFNKNIDILYQWMIC